MAAPFLITPRADETVDNGIVHMNVLVEPDRSESFAIFVSTFPPLGGGPPSHHHNSYDESFYVLSGEMEFRVEATSHASQPDRWPGSREAPPIASATPAPNPRACSS